MQDRDSPAVKKGEETFGDFKNSPYLLPLSPIIELFSINIEMRSVFRSFASEIDLEG